MESIIEDVRHRGNEAIRHYSQTFDDWSPASFRLSPEQIDAIISSLPSQVVDDIRYVQEQVRNFARAQRASMTDVEVETLPGVVLGHRHTCRCRPSARTFPAAATR